MRKLGVDAERKNVVAAQWAQQTTDASEKAKIESCSSEIRQASIDIVQPQVSRVQSVTTDSAQLAALNDLHTKWLAYMNSITLKGTDASLAKAFNNAANNLDKM
jgi:ABC-type transporter Mla MlaB component